jgi:mevalonate kinase
MGISKKLNKRQEVGFEVTVNSELPPGAGLGSSAAFSTSVTAALLNYFKGKESEVSQDLISRWAFKCEHIFHGKPSGIDNSICSFGGAVRFRDGKVIEHLTSFPKMPALLVYTNVMRNTKVLVERVTRKREKYATVIHHTMEAIDTISSTAWDLIKQGKYCGLERDELVEMNHQLLNLLGAGHETIDKVLSIAKKHGQTGKLTGAGGGGCVILHLNTGMYFFIL